MLKNMKCIWMIILCSSILIGGCTTSGLFRGNDIKEVIDERIDEGEGMVIVDLIDVHYDDEITDSIKLDLLISLKNNTNNELVIINPNDISTTINLGGFKISLEDSFGNQIEFSPPPWIYKAYQTPDFITLQSSEFIEKDCYIYLPHYLDKEEDVYKPLLPGKYKVRIEYENYQIGYYATPEYSTDTGTFGDIWIIDRHAWVGKSISNAQEIDILYDIKNKFKIHNSIGGGCKEN